MPRTMYPKKIHPRFSRTTRTILDTVVFGWAIGGIVLALLLMFAGGCSAAGDEREQILSVSFAPELRAEGERAIGRIAAATGIVIVQSPDGVPVRMQKIVRGDDGGMICGGTIAQVEPSGITRSVSEINISSTRTGLRWYGGDDGHCTSVSIDLTHELLHFVEATGNHSVDGVLFNGASDDTITESVIETVCATAQCTAYNPEGK